MEAPQRYDVVIVGGRPAGASLAARLGKLGQRVLVVDRATFPSMPNVPTCPTLHMGTLALLDELGIDEASYAGEAVRFRTFLMEFGGHFTTPIPIPPVHGRAYGYSIDRHHFDQVLWDHLDRFATVEKRSEFTFDDVLKDDAGRVIGIVGRSRGGEPEQLLAPWVIGADGRFSAVARAVGAKTVEEHAEKVSTVYFADWTGVRPFHDGHPEVPGRPAAGEDVVQVHATGRGLNILFFPLSRGRLTICVHQRADRVEAALSEAKDPETFYRATLAAHPAVGDRLQGAEMTGRLVGLKRVGNGFREAAGPGWMLCGDALHYKDPVDGQGIYDALLETRILAEELEASRSGGKAPDAVAAGYTERVRAATRPMYLATCKRLETELYSEPPVPVIRTMLRWALSDPEYQERFLRFLGRDLDPETWAGPGLMLRASARGLWGDLTRPFRRAPATAAAS